VLRLATIGASSTRRRINQPQRVRPVCLVCVSGTARSRSPARQSVTNFCASIAARRRRATSAANRRPRGVRGKAESDRGTTTGRPGRRRRRQADPEPRRDGRCRTGQGRSLAVTRRYINVLLNTDGMACFEASESASARRTANCHSSSHLIPTSLSVCLFAAGVLPFTELDALQLVMHGRYSGVIGR